MKKIFEFFKSNILIVRWTIGYFFVLWLILKYIFRFNPFSYYYWWKFFHATLHGFGGFVFGWLIYSAIPIYIASVYIIYRKKEPIITIPIIDKVFVYISKIFSKPEPIQTDESIETETTDENKSTKPELPSDLPPELRVPYTRVREKLSLTGAISVYNKQPQKQTIPQNDTNESESTPIPIPTDFDISDAFSEMNDSVPTFTDINFDTPITTEKELKNNTTKYFDKNKTEYETYRDFVATEKYLIYEHNDEDFWIMDEDAWFAAGKQKDSPTKELIEIAKQNGLTPVIYLHSQNIMDIDGAIATFESMNIRVIKDLNELN